MNVYLILLLINRLVQYTSRLVWYNLERRGSSQSRVDKVKRLDEILGLMRRCKYI